MAAADWRDGVARLGGLLSALSMRDRSGNELPADTGYALWRDAIVLLRRARRTIFLIGNGASASMASHMAADLAKNARVHTQCFTDLALLTAISNDMGYEWVFAEPLRRQARRGDMLVAVSSSGASANVTAACDVAAELGLTVVTLSAMSPENPLRAKGQLNAYVPAATYGEAETCHAAILHHMMDLVENRTTPLGPGEREDVDANAHLIGARP